MFLTMSKTVTYAEFDLIKVKSGKGLSVVFYDKQNPNKEFTVNSMDAAHPDLLDSLNALDECLAISIGVTDGWAFAREHNRKDEDALKKP